jgi:hypothetical protein
MRRGTIGGRRTDPRQPEQGHRAPCAGTLVVGIAADRATQDHCVAEAAAPPAQHSTTVTDDDATAVNDKTGTEPHKHHAESQPDQLTAGLHPRWPTGPRQHRGAGGNQPQTALR